MASAERDIPEDFHPEEAQISAMLLLLKSERDYYHQNLRKSDNELGKIFSAEARTLAEVSKILEAKIEAKRTGNDIIPGIKLSRDKDHLFISSPGVEEEKPLDTVLPLKVFPREVRNIISSLSEEKEETGIEQFQDLPSH